VKVPPQVESVIMKSLEKNRDNRYATAADFEHALEAIRNTVPPDQKYGLGERMITLSGAQTLAELPKFTASGPNATYSGGQQATQQTMTGQPTQAETSMPPPRTGTTGTKIGSDEATVMERNLGPTGTMPGPQSTRAGSDEATMMERLASTAAPTAAEQKWSGPGAAEATMIERKVSPSSFAPKKSNTGMMIGIAAALIIVLGGGYLFWKSKQQATSFAPVSTTVVTTTAPTSTAPPLGGKGVLLLSASPWGELDKIIDDKGKSIDITDEDKSTPTSIKLDPGNYMVTMSDTKGKSQTMSITVEAGKPVKRRFDFDPVNFDELQKEVVKP
jgi:hypothetical protein